MSIFLFSDTLEECVPPSAFKPSRSSAADSSNTPQAQQHSESSLTNKLPPTAERTVPGDTIVSVTSDSAGLIPA